MFKDLARIDGMAARIIGLCAVGLTVRDIQSRLLDLYGLKVSPDLISRVTDAVLNEVRDWQSRAPERMYPIVIFDALRVKIRDADSRTVKIEPARRHRFETAGEGPCMSPSASPSASPARSCARSWACGSPKTKEPGSGSR